MMRVLLIGGSLMGTADAAISVAAGVVETFDTLPSASDWSTGDGTAGDVFDGTGTGEERAQFYDGTTNWADDVVNGVSQSDIGLVLGMSSTTPPSTNLLARWNSTDQNIQTRPTGNNATTLMATLMNDTGASAPSLSISYDFLVSDEMGDEQAPGYQAFYSIAGDGSDWVSIPEFEGLTPGSRSVQLNFNGGWAAGDNLYILWIDDNAANINGQIPDDGLSIDNFLAVVPEPSTALLTCLALLSGISRRSRR